MRSERVRAELCSWASSAGSSHVEIMWVGNAILSTPMARRVASKIGAPMAEAQRILVARDGKALLPHPFDHLAECVAVNRRVLRDRREGQFFHQLLCSRFVRECQQHLTRSRRVHGHVRADLPWRVREQWPVDADQVGRFSVIQHRKPRAVAGLRNQRAQQEYRLGGEIVLVEDGELIMFMLFS